MKIGFDTTPAAPAGTYSRHLAKLLARYVPYHEYVVEGERYKEVDLYHCSRAALPLMVRLRSIPFVVTVHNLNFLRYPHLYSLAERLVVLRLYRRALRDASRLITVNNDAREELSERLSIDPRRIEVMMPLAARVPQEPPAQAQLEVVRRKYMLPKEFVLMLGTVEPRHNHEVVFEALLALRDKARERRAARERANPERENTAGPERRARGDANYVGADSDAGAFSGSDSGSGGGAFSDSDNGAFPGADAVGEMFPCADSNGRAFSGADTAVAAATEGIRNSERASKNTGMQEQSKDSEQPGTVQTDGPAICEGQQERSGTAETNGPAVFDGREEQPGTVQTDSPAVCDGQEEQPGIVETDGPAVCEWQEGLTGTVRTDGPAVCDGQEELPGIVICGRRTTYSDFLLGYARARHLAAQVDFIYELKPDDLPALFGMARAFVYLPDADCEASIVPVVEALRAGLPMVLSDTRLNREAAGDAAVYVRAEAVHEVAAAFEKVVCDEEFRHEIQARARHRAELFSEFAVAERLMQIYSSL